MVVFRVFPSGSRSVGCGSKTLALAVVAGARVAKFRAKVC